RGCNAFGVLGADAELCAGLPGQLDLLLDLAGRIAEKADLDLLTRLATGRHDGQRPREGADVQAVHAGAVTAIGAVAHLYDIGTVCGGDDGADAILLIQRRIIGGRQLEALAVENGDVGIEEGDAQPHRLDLDGQPLSLLQLDGVVIDVLGIDDTLDSHVERNLLGLVELAVGLLLSDGRQRPDPDGAQLADATLGPQPYRVFARKTVLGDLDGRLDLAVVDDLELRDAEAGRVEEDFLSVGQPSAVEGEDYLL